MFSTAIKALMETHIKAMHAANSTKQDEIKKREAEIKELERMAATPFPSAKIPECQIKDEDQRYEEVAQLLGFAPAELVRVQLLKFFQQEAIKLYDYKHVSAWLTKKRKEQSENSSTEFWCWRPLRKKDIITTYGWKRPALGGYDDDLYMHRWPSCKPYEELVPLHALEKVAKIEEKFKDKVKFFVSAYASNDPFIMVRPAMRGPGSVLNYNLVFDIWDEPGFGV